MTDGPGVRADLKRLEEEGRAELSAARGETLVQAVRTKYLGRKGLLTQFLREMGKLPVDQRPAVGQLANEVKAKLEEAAEKALGKERSRHSCNKSTNTCDRRLFQKFSTGCGHASLREV